MTQKIADGLPRGFAHWSWKQMIAFTVWGLTTALVAKGDAILDRMERIAGGEAGKPLVVSSAELREVLTNQAGLALQLDAIDRFHGENVPRFEKAMVEIDQLRKDSIQYRADVHELRLSADALENQVNRLMGAWEAERQRR